MKKTKAFIIKALITAVVYSVLLLPFQMNLPLLSGTDIRPSAFLPIVLGIFWGMPAAVGIFFGNLICDLICINSPLIIIGSLMNGLSAICARRLFYSAWGHRITKGEYLYSLGTLLNFLLTTLGVELILCLPISLTVHYFSGSSVQAAFSLIFLNNIHSNIIFGIPAMLFLPVINKWGDEPSGDGGIKGSVIALLFILSSLILFIPFIISNPHPAWITILAVPLIGASIFATPATTIEKDSSLFGFQSIRHKTFRQLMMIALGISILCSIVLISLMGADNRGNDVIEVFTKAYHICAYISVMFLVLFALTNHVVERNLLSPIRNLAAKISLSGEKYENELDILNKRLDFVASENSAFVTSDEYSIFVGLSSQDNMKKYSIKEAREIINGICLKYVGGYISTQEAEGGYKGIDTAGSEQILIYTIFGADDGQIRDISNEIILTLNQESVLVEKNRLTRYYLYGDKSCSAT